MTITLNGTTGITTPALDSVAPFSSADMPAGSVIQVVQGQVASQFSTTSGSDQDTGLKATITPISASNNILVIVSSMLRAAGGQCFVYQKLWRGAVGSTMIHDGYPIVGSINDTDLRGVGAVTLLDSPSTTSAITYTVSINSAFASTVYMSSTTSPSTITLMEIAG